MDTAKPQQHAYLLDAHIPLDRRRALAQDQALSERAWGSVLFADLSGFTPLMEHLANTLGPQQGAEELTLLLNALFTPLIDEVHRHGGSIVAFGGDALTCWFPGELGTAVPRAAAAALAMQHHVTHLGSVSTPAGPVRFSMHLGIASGQVRRCPVGRPPHGILDVLAGSPLDRMADAQHRAGAGQVVVDAATAAHLPPTAQQPVGEGFALLSKDATALAAELAEAPLPPPLSPRQVRQWLAEPLYRRLRAVKGAFSAELRLVTSMFVQFAGLDYDGDSQVGDKLNRYVTLAQEHLAPYEGHLGMVDCGDKGSLLLIFFGAPIAHEDDPDRAVGFALSFQEAVKDLAFIQEQRIGISLGRVYAGILGAPGRCTYTVLGDEVNLSARLMQVADSNQILVSQWVQQAATGRYAFRALGAVPVKGKEKPVPIFEPTAPRERRTHHADEPGDRERLIGREQEWGRLADLLADIEVGESHVLQIVGEAGVGKSALLRALLRQTRERGWPTHVGTCLSYGKNTPYLPWRAILEEIGELSPEMEPAERVDRLEKVVANLPAPPDHPGYWRARFPLLAEAIGLEVPDSPLTRAMEGELRRDNTFQILAALVQHQTIAGPAVVVIEDAQWADELSLSLAGHIGRGMAEGPLLLVLVHRPFVDAVPPAVRALTSLPAQRRTTVSLATLSQDAALELARQRLHGATLASPLEALLQERAQGNPFFIEELLRALQEGGYLQREDGTVALSGDWEDLEIPDTIEGIVRARMDRLPEGERLTLKVSSVIGRNFQRPVLASIHPAQTTSFTLDRQLIRLGKANFTQLQEAAPEWLYAFRQPILHEVTYETLLFAQRRQLHGAIGDVLEDRYTGDLPRVLDLLAYHYARSEKREKAVHYLQRAGDKARREYANEVALGYYSQALERLLPEEEERRYDLLAGRERIHDLLGERTAQEEDLLDMGRLAKTLSRQVEVLNRQARRAVDMGAFEPARQFVQRAWTKAREGRDQAGAAESQKILGTVHGILGEYQEALHFFTQSRQIYQGLGDHQGETACLLSLGTVHLYQGDTEQARSYYTHALELARDTENRLQENKSLINLGLAESYLGDNEHALESLHQALTISREIGSAADEESALENIGMLEMALGDLDNALIHQQEALQLARLLEDREGEAVGLANLGLLSTYRGDLEQAQQLLQQALDKYREIGHRRGEASTLHYLGLASLQAGKTSKAREVFQQAIELRQEIGETGNALHSKAWLGLACLGVGEQEQAGIYIQQVMAQLANKEYSGDEPEQEIWWAAYQVWQACGDEGQAQHALGQAHRLVQEQAGRIRDPILKQSFMEQVSVNREILRA